jgi:hypothetical protein
MISFRRLSELVRTNKKWIWIGLATVPAIRLCYVQEMIAALIMFSVLFVGVLTLVPHYFPSGSRQPADHSVGRGRCCSDGALGD